MSNNYGTNVAVFNNDYDKCYTILSKHLNKGSLGLFLGAGASAAMGLPTWDPLVKSICKEKPPAAFDATKKYTNQELKELITEVKDSFAGKVDEYLELVKKHLYDGVVLDFDIAKKELLIALSSLIVGTSRGTIQSVITLNFDSIFEWYLSILGLKTNILTKERLLRQSCDVEITHINGYLPYSNKYGKNSDFLIFSDEDFEDRMMSLFDYWKDHQMEFFRRNVFLSIGVSASSLIGDIRPYLKALDDWYEIQKMKRMFPYGFAFVSTETTSAQISKLNKMGIAVCVFEHSQVPHAIFEIVQRASDGK